jgi:hypothetical protein
MRTLIYAARAVPPDGLDEAIHAASPGKLLSVRATLVHRADCAEYRGDAVALARFRGVIAAVDMELAQRAAGAVEAVREVVREVAPQPVAVDGDEGQLEVRGQGVQPVAEFHVGAAAGGNDDRR